MIQDNRFFHLAAHVDETLKDKIIKGEYVDLSKLLVKQPKWSGKSDVRMDLDNRDGHSSWVPAHERELPVINSFHRWEEAFRMCAGIYTTVHPKRASQIFQHVETIHIASQTCVWDNV